MARTGKKDAATEFLRMIGYPHPDDRHREDNPLRLLGVPAWSAEAELFATEVFVYFINHSDWGNFDKRIWLDIYLFHLPAAQLARRYNRTEEWIYRRFHRQHKLLSQRVNDWWKQMMERDGGAELPSLMQQTIDKVGAAIESNEELDNQDDF